MEETTPARPPAYVRLWTAIRQYDYGGALERITFTAIGLLLALGINSWNDNRKQRITEAKTLRELKVALEQDLADIRITIQGTQQRAVHIRNFMHHINTTSEYHDSLSQHIQGVLTWYQLLANTAAYENLKSRGLELISNDSLRLAIVTLYEVQYETVRLREGMINRFYETRLLPLFMAGFSPDGQIRFQHFKILEKNSDLSGILVYTLATNNQSNESYKELEKIITALLEMLPKDA